VRQTLRKTPFRVKTIGQTQVITSVFVILTCCLKELTHFLYSLSFVTRNTLDCDQSNYSSRIVFSHMPIAFGQTGISAIRSADPENPTVEPNMKWIG